VARFCNRYPSIELSFEVQEPESLVTGESIVVQVRLERELEEGVSDVGPVVAPFYPQKKDEGWWLVIGDQAGNSLLVIKRLTLQRQTEISLDFEVATPGTHKLKLFFMCDSYTGCDQEHDLTIKVAKGVDAEEEGGDAEAMNE
jgi:pre-mRNA-splicing helicase BRR2